MAAKVSKGSGNTSAQALFSNLGLLEKYQKKLGLQDALRIELKPLLLSLNEYDGQMELTHLPYVILQKLMSFDRNCRSDLLKDTHGKKRILGDITINPLDGLLALIHCSDPFLQQDLFSRLAKCQIAVPLILPDPFTKKLILPLWAMRSIIKDWKCKQEERVVDCNSCIINYPTPVISFLRFGKIKKRGLSKSYLLNCVTESPQFFNRRLSGGSYRHVMEDGLVDMSWYLPNGKTDDLFPNVVTFVNLHGDARQHPKQMKFLSEISSMCFILLLEEHMELDQQTFNILQRFSSSGSIVLLNDCDEPKEEIFKEYNVVQQSNSTDAIVPHSDSGQMSQAICDNVTVVDLDSKGESDIAVDIRQSIHKKQFSSKQQKFMPLEKLCKKCVPNSEICGDEYGEAFNQGLQKANEVINLIESEGSIKPHAKQEMLPLQGTKMWRAWANWNKELHRLKKRGKDDIYVYSATVESKMYAIRRQQQQHHVSPLMRSFIDSLIALQGEKNIIERNFFLQQLKLRLNRLSEKRVSDLRRTYEGQRKIFFDLQANKKSTDECKKKLEALQIKIVEASFGVHHLFRELGQIYETECVSCRERHFLPKIVAELLLTGQSLELMDGDAAHVPVEWVKAVINELDKILVNSEVFVLSVLGIQSSGKSTMLNTVFGLQFSTSTGRCTRGAFMQLLPVDLDIRKGVKQYVLVVDTEGLRTPELDSSETRKHDNELATFVIGLASITGINIRGNVAGDMEDILQTTVHAFLRMKKVQLNPSCLFIHQNAKASEKLYAEQDKFVEQLDRCTLSAAREADCEEDYKKFSDVIQFNIQDDVHHFEGLLTKPMDHVNYAYSRDAQKLKLNFLNKLRSTKAGSITLSTFKFKVQDLWKALLQEDFVFSFRNTEEIIAFNSLGVKFNQWEAIMLDKMLDWEKRAANEIRTSGKVPEQVQSVVDKKKEELPGFIKEIYESLLKDMKKFFEQDRLNYIIIQWQAQFETRLELVKKDLETRAAEQCDSLGKSVEAIVKFENDTASIDDAAQQVIIDLKKEQEQLIKSVEERKLEELNESQMETFMKLFVPEKVQQYVNEGLLTREDCKNLSRSGIIRLVNDGILTPERVQIILKKGQLTPEELLREFNEKWEKMVNCLPSVFSAPVNVDAKVQKKLVDHKKKLEKLLIPTLKKGKLRDFSESLGFFVYKGTHFKTKQDSSWHGRVITWGCSFLRQFRNFTDPHEAEAQKITVEVFAEAKKFFNDIKKKKTEYKDKYTHDLLQTLDSVIEKKSKSVAAHFTFTDEYRRDVYLTACSYAVKVFEEMGTEFRKQNNPRQYAEKLRASHFTQFKNLYYKTAAEEALADNLCALISSPLEQQIMTSLGSKVILDMRRKAYLSDKMSLKAKILIDLGTQKDFSKYVTYLTDIKKSLQEWIEIYVMNFCNEMTSGNKTHLQAVAKEEVTDAISTLKKSAKKITDTAANEWLASFCDDSEVRGELGVRLNASSLRADELASLNLKHFKEEMEEGLSQLEKRLHAGFDKIYCDRKQMQKWQDKLFILLQGLHGCTKQCPFCGEQCDLGEHDDTEIKHTAAQHRPICCGSYRDVETERLATSICPTRVASENGTFQNSNTDWKPHLYKHYRKIYPRWHIPPDPAATSSLYWKWFVGQYIEELAEEFDAKLPDTPDIATWKRIKWEDVKINMRSQYNL